MDQSNSLDLNTDQNGNTTNEDERRTKVMKHNDQVTAEFRLALFSAALFSLRSTTLLKPYPNEYYNSITKEIDRDKLINVFNNVPSFNDLTPSTTSPESDLRDWIVTHGTMQLQLVSMADLPKDAQTKLTKNQSNITNKTLKPHFIFQVTEPIARRSKAENFSNLKALYGSFYAFHGSALENYHSILHNGLAISLNKRSLFGFGTYLSSKLSTAIEFSPFSNNFYANTRKGLLGRRLSCVALCEVISHPDVEAKKKKEKGMMPSAYYVVSNNDLIRVAYLLVYSSQNDKIKFINFSTSSRRKLSENSISSAFVLVFIIITVLLIGYGLTKNRLDY